jgi:hypothetical protein
MFFSSNKTPQLHGTLGYDTLFLGHAPKQKLRPGSVLPLDRTVADVGVQCTGNLQKFVQINHRSIQRVSSSTALPLNQFHALETRQPFHGTG